MSTLTNDPTESEATDFAVRWAQAQEAREAELDGYGHGHGPDDYTTEYSRADEELAMRVHREELERVEMEAFQRVLVSHCLLLTGYFYFLIFTVAEFCLTLFMIRTRISQTSNLLFFL